MKNPYRAYLCKWDCSEFLVSSSQNELYHASRRPYFPSLAQLHIKWVKWQDKVCSDKVTEMLDIYTWRSTSDWEGL